MCGFVGILSPHSPPQHAWLENMSWAISHRGPDDAGVYVDRQAGFGMAHRRLSILDISHRGRQPMASHSGRYVIAYNGEIYNHLEIRQELEKVQADLKFDGTSDTETLLAAIDYWGLEKTIERLNGMFAFALWDAKEKRLCLARDRMGEKPLYVGWIGTSIVFASELKPLLKAYSLRVEPQAISLMVGLGYIPEPWSIIGKIYKLPSAHFLWLSPEDSFAPKDITSFRSSAHCYWSLSEIVTLGVRRHSGNIQDVIEQLDQLLRCSVRQRMLSDVPLGACLSGGIDSSTVVALMQAYSSQPVRTFTIGFDEEGYDESAYARNVARHIGSDHTEVILKPRDALSLIPELPSIYDEPFADVSQVPTLLVSQMLRKHVKVALSGDGADELFFGYDRYRIASRLWRFYGWQPRWMRRWIAKQSNFLFNENYRFWRLVQRLSAPDFDAFYLAFASISPNPHLLLPGAPPLWKMLPSLPFDQISQEARMMYRDQIQYLPDDILVKVDRASMAVGLEMRAPFLDHLIVEWAWSLPIGYKQQNGQGKWILRQVLKKYLPENLFDRPKQGFAVPIDEWLRGPLIEWANHLLSPQSVALCPGLDYAAVKRIWHSHQERKINAGYLLWNLLMLLAWFEEWHL
ncbi:MAG: asparagine synthase (glutamine-hydrolyzing) [Candidatus Methylumidiphilus sp.]